MGNKEDFEKIKEFELNRNIEQELKYKVNLNENFEKKLKRTSIIIRGTIGFITLVIILIFYYSICSTNKYTDSMLRKAHIQSFCNNEEVEEVPITVKLSGNGLYSYTIKNIPKLEIHSLFVKNKNIILEDATSRFYKYFFEKWDDTNKDRFVIVESYKNVNYKNIRKKDWFLEYKTYIQVNSYEELLQATEAIIRFVEFTGYSQILFDSYIKVGDCWILPHNSSSQTSEEIRNSAKVQYFLITEKNESLYDFENREYIEKYSSYN